MLFLTVNHSPRKLINSVLSILKEIMVRKLIANSQMNVHRTELERFISSCSCTGACKCSSDQDMYKEKAFPNSLKFEVKITY